MAKKEKSFEVVSTENTSIFGFDCTVVVDKATGVNYIVIQGATGVSVTPRLNPNGTVRLSSVSQREGVN